MPKQTIKGEIVDSYLSRFSGTPSNTLAKKILKENKLVFDDVDNIRSIIRSKRGLMGEVKRKISTITDPKKVGHFPSNPYKLPESHAEPREPYVLPKANNNILVISDMHIPYHDIAAITAALKYGEEQKVNTIVILGDLIDFATISRFEKDPRARSVREEFDATRDVLSSIRKSFPTQKIIWLKGNHDIRYEKWLFLKAPEIFDDSYYLLEERLRLNELRIEILPDTTLINAGKLILSHGHLTIRGVFAPVNAARGVFIRAKASMLVGHCHQTSEHTEMTLKGEMISCWSIGALCTLKPTYDPQNTKHNHGFAHIKVDRDGGYNVSNKRIFNGKIL